MSRATKADGSPWWTSAEAGTEGIDLGEVFDVSQAALTAGLGVMGAFAQIVSKPLTTDGAQAEPHSIADCGICPVCVAVTALKQHEPGLAALVEAALGGVTHSAERIAEAIPNVRDAITDQLVAAVTKSVLTRFGL